MLDEGVSHPLNAPESLMKSSVELLGKAGFEPASFID